MVKRLLVLMSVMFVSISGLYAQETLEVDRDVGGYNHCGDGLFMPLLGEECDDGNYEDGDGCNHNCMDENSNRTTTQDTLMQHSLNEKANAIIDSQETLPAHVFQGRSEDDEKSLTDSGSLAPVLLITPSTGGVTSIVAVDIPVGSGEMIDELIDDRTLMLPTYVCGNGIEEPGEGCDDGNQENGDGCAITCQVEQEEALIMIKQTQARGQQLVRTSQPKRGVGYTQPYPQALSQTGVSLGIHTQSMLLFAFLLLSGLCILILGGRKTDAVHTK